MFGMTLISFYVRLATIYGTFKIILKQIMIDTEILKIAKKAHITVVNDQSVLKIRHQLSWKDKSFWGILIFLFAGIFFIVIPFIKNSDTTSQIIGIVIGAFFLLAGIATLIRNFYDGLTISDDKIFFRYNLKSTTKLIGTHFKIKMRTEIIKNRRAGVLGTEFIVLTYYLQEVQTELPVFYFQMENKHYEKALLLGTELMRITNLRLKGN